MVNIEVKLPIGSDKDNRWLASWGEDEAFFTLQTVKDIFGANREEKDFRLNFNCDGGSVEDGFAIYDYLRTSGKNLHCNIEGGCHSMAVVLLLAAPAQNRTANPNCRALLHKVRTFTQGSFTAEELETMARETAEYEKGILDIYADRTGRDRGELEALMREEKTRTAQELLRYGFISKINTYNTNKKTTFNNKEMEIKELTKRLTANISQLRRIAGLAANFDFTDKDGNVLFSTEAEDDTLEVGMPASPDGTYTLEDGRTVVIAEGVISEIGEPQPSNEDEDPEKEELKAEIERLKKENEELKAKAGEAANMLEEANRALRTNYRAPRRGAAVKNTVAQDDFKAQMRAAYKKGGRHA